MKHYPHHIGDFDRATRHLTRLERSVYRDLLDLYYDTEQPLQLDVDKLCRRIIARTNEESTAVEQVLTEFFVETPLGWYQDRCEAEIAAYRANSSQKALAGKASAEAKRLRKQQALNGTSTAVEQPLPSVSTETNGASTNHQPSTINHQPGTINREPFGEAPSSANVVGAAGAAKQQRGTVLPADWRLPKAWSEWALAEYPHWTPEAVRIEADKFADHWRTKTGKDARKADWQATWRNWCRSDFAQRSHQAQRVPAKPSQMTPEQRDAWAQQEDEKARRLLFGNVLDVESSPVIGISNF